MNKTVVFLNLVDVVDGAHTHVYIFRGVRLVVNGKLGH